MLIQKIRIPKFHFVIYDAIIETPITPPSIILFGKRNISKPTATIKAPKVKKMTLAMYSRAISPLVFLIGSGFFLLKNNFLPFLFIFL